MSVRQDRVAKDSQNLRSVSTETVLQRIAFDIPNDSLWEQDRLIVVGRPIFDCLHLFSDVLIELIG